MTTHTLAFESLLDPSNEVRKAAEAAFHALRESEPALVCTQLVAGLAHGPQVRQLCAVLLRRYLPAMGPQISREMWEAVKAGLLQALAAEPDAAQRRKLCDAVGRLGAEFYVDGNWPELAQFISGACTAGEPAAHEAAITIVAHMAPALVEPDAWAQHGGPLTGMLVAALDNFAQPAVQGAALSALATLLRNAAEASEANKGKDEVRKAKAVVASMAHVLGKMLGVLEGAVNAGEAGRMLGVVQDISDVAGAAPRLFKMLLPQVLEGMAALATSPLAADVRVACAELLMTLAEGAPKMVAKLPQYGGRVLSVLVPMMVNLEGLQPTSYCHFPYRRSHHLLPLLQVNLNPDASDWEEAEPDDGLDADDEEDEADRESSYAKEGLDRLCEAMDGEAIVELLLPQLQGMLGPQASWQQRHASLVAIAQVAEHGGPKLEPHLPALMNLAAAAASDAHPRLRWAAFYCAGLLCDQFPALAEEQSEALVPLLLGGAADACPRVQAAACLAGVNLVEAMPEAVAPPTTSNSSPRSTRRSPATAPRTSRTPPPPSSPSSPPPSASPSARPTARSCPFSRRASAPRSARSGGSSPARSSTRRAASPSRRAPRPSAPTRGDGAGDGDSARRARDARRQRPPRGDPRFPCQDGGGAGRALRPTAHLPSSHFRRALRVDRCVRRSSPTPRTTWGSRRRGSRSATARTTTGSTRCTTRRRRAAAASSSSSSTRRSSRRRSPRSR